MCFNQFDFLHNALFIFNRKVDCADGLEKSIKPMTLSIFRVIGCLPHVSHFQAHAPHKLWIKPELTESVYQALWYSWNRSKPDWVCLVLSTQNFLCNSVFVVQHALWYWPHIAFFFCCSDWFIQGAFTRGMCSVVWFSVYLFTMLPAGAVWYHTQLTIQPWCIWVHLTSSLMCI